MTIGRLIEISVFPAILLAACGADYLLLPYFASEAYLLLTGLICLAVMPVVVALEYFRPFRREWFRNQGDFWTDFVHTHLAFPALLRVAELGLGLVVAQVALVWAAAGRGWPRAWPFLAQLALAIFLSEFGFYWVHRFLHRLPAGWRFHLIHHTAPRVYWMNSGRFHPLETVLTACVFIAPLVALGVPARVLAVFWTWNAIHGYLEHANIRYEIGPLNWIFNSAQLHRWHHSQVIDESNRNFGKTLIIWDVLFGTRFLPSRGREVGVPGVAGLGDFPRGYGAHLAYPFRKEARRA